jgi:predicted  nucleic acid-binding Zn-ribbon protein
LERVRVVQPVEMKGKLEEKIRALEKEKSMLLEEVRELKEVVELSERAKGLESEVDRLKSEVRALRDRLPREFLREIGEFVSESITAEEEEDSEECSGCEEEELL